MAQLHGTNVSAPILPFTTDDTYATHLAKYGKGGYRTVDNIAERDSIPASRLEEGMLVWVISDPDQKHLYQYRAEAFHVFEFGGGSSDGSGIERVQEVSDLSGVLGDFAYVESKETLYVRSGTGEWKPIKSSGGGETIITSGGIPIYTQEMIDALDPKPTDYISIPSESEIYQGNGYYMDILFGAIRNLQAEVARLRNSFRYGINSYTGKDTAMSRVVDSIETDPEEPLWATTEEDLSIIPGAGTELTDGHTLEPKDNVEVAEGSLIINPNATWEDLVGAVKSTEDSKLYLYLTTSGKNIRVGLESLEPDEPGIDLSLGQLPLPRSASRYNILIIISRKVKSGELWASDNYIWISVANWETGKVIGEGYYDPISFELKNNKVSLGSRYYFSNIEFFDLSLYKFDLYSKYQDFSGEVIPSTPSDEDYKYKVAHITIRSVSNYAELKSIEDQLPKNELIYNEESGTLYIKTATKVKPISGGGGSDGPGEDTDSGMEKQEIIEWLASNGIIVTDEGGDLQLSQVADITFVHQGTGKKFKFEADSEGNLHATELSNKSYSDILLEAGFDPDTAEWGYRGFVGSLGHNILANSDSPVAIGKDHGLYADRVKIGAIYAPRKNQSVYGCSHAYIELENTSDRDFLLDGCYLHYATGTSGTSADITTYHLALEGKIPAGGTYLIRGKQYTDSGQANCFINVATYDKEWYVDNNELIDLSVNQSNTYLLTYGLPDLPWTAVMWRLREDTATDRGKCPWDYDPHYIDCVSIGSWTYTVDGDNSASPWNPYKIKYSSGKPDAINAAAAYKAQTFDCIYKNTFELEPAKQGFQSCGTIDSSRLRGVTAPDYQYVKLEKDVIEFPKSSETFPVSKYTPKASFEHKNVCTDKSKLDMNKPNMVTCSFGINIHTTRCFNWISAGEFDEFVWLRPLGSESWSSRFETYKSGKGEKDAPGGMTRVEFDSPLREAAYERLKGTFPADGTHYTSHKCIIKVVSESPEEVPQVYEYIVGRADKNMQPDPDHTSRVQRFTLYPNTYEPRIFQTTDQQGFHWIEYQAWAAAAEKINTIIADAQEGENIIPILVNTGDMTQNGTRINEWLDYYNAGACLFDHLEQMNVVGNNDLVGTDPEKLGTGDDNGKSNGHYFHVFYCYEVDPEINPIIPSSDETQYKYVPSFYYFENESSDNIDSYRFVFLNTEITKINCRDWYKRTINGVPVNVYTGWPIDGTESTYDSGFETIYTKIYNILSAAQTNGQHVIAACHEMPFTVVTKANLDKETSSKDRSMNSSSLVGCHCNRMGSDNEKSIYWLSRLLENFGVKLMIGGHKHTYACTNPVREFYFYDGGAKNSLIDGPMQMESTLEHDNLVSWSAEFGQEVAAAKSVYTLESEGTKKVFNTTKIPIMDRIPGEALGITINSDTIWPYYGVENDAYPKVVYAMCQATGFKLKSNKELPCEEQKFSYVIPHTKHGAAGDTPNDNQLQPMFSEVHLSGDHYTVYLTRIEEIQKIPDNKTTPSVLSQIDFSTKAIKLMYLKGNEAASESDNAMYGHWVDNKVALIEI